MRLPLEGVRVLDLSRYLPGPFCTQIMADFGAEVVKVEDPRGGELGRHLDPLIGGQSARFYTVNRNKKSITLDLRKEDGKAIFKQLVLNSDVVVDQFRPGVMDKMGLGYEKLKRINERIIYCSITGYGLDGPLRDAAGHDLNYLSLAGVTGLTGAYREAPAMSGAQIADIAGGTLYAVIAILLALVSRKVTGKGQLCDVSMMDGSISLLAYTLGEWSGWGRLPERGNELLTGGYACYKIYATKDNRHVSLGAIEDKFWAEFCQKVEREEYIRFQWDKERQPDIIADIEEIIRGKTREEWEAFFAGSDICFTPVLDLEEMCRHPQVAARDMILKLENIAGSGKDMILTGIPIKLSETPGKVELNFPELGEHNNEILQAAGYTLEEIEEFRKRKVI
ncbi:MAG: CoA transferase [Syntrophomonadaceae bacterium]|nr:CoA transferase [Syntrophomonadaceae bacterium]